MNIGERLRKARKRIGKRQCDIAKEVGITQPTVSAWESGDAEPGKWILRRVAKAYEISLEQLIPKAA